MARPYRPNLADSDARMRPNKGGLPGGNIVDQGKQVKGVAQWQKMAGYKSNTSSRATGPLVDPNTKDKAYVHGHER